MGKFYVDSLSARRVFYKEPLIKSDDSIPLKIAHEGKKLIKLIAEKRFFVIYDTEEGKKSENLFFAPSMARRCLYD